MLPFPRHQTTIRPQVAGVVRQHPDPPHGADGKFYSPGEHDEHYNPPTVAYTPQVPANWQAIVQSANLPDDEHERTTICARCSRMVNGPLAGHKLGFVPPTDTGSPGPDGRGWSHGVCALCLLAGMRTSLRSKLTRMGLAESQIRDLIDELHAASYPQLKAFYDAHFPPPPEERMMVHISELRQRLLALATVCRNYTFVDAHGNTHLVTQGEGACGKVTRSLSTQVAQHPKVVRPKP